VSMLGTAEAAGIRTTLGLLLAHRYTRTAITQGSENAWGQTAATPGTPATSLPCLYAPTTTLRTDDLGRVTLDQPSLRIPITDVLAVGDLVSDIRDQEGTLLLAGPLTVESIRPVAGLGANLQRRAILHGAGVAE
jgi:hypothetical protein